LLSLSSATYGNSGYRLRGQQFTDAAGRYYLETIVPGEYPGCLANPYTGSGYRYVVRTDNPRQPRCLVVSWLPRAHVALGKRHP
jgi:protocatechuate 3,4-dioxygenase beta subunit